jgi:predicted nucleotidyltransferase
MKADISFSKEELRAFCQKHGIRRLAIFGSALRDDFRPDSDIDVLVEFHPDRIPTLFDIAGMEEELSRLFHGHQVDVRTPEDLSRYFRAQVMAEAEVQYAAA